MNFAKWGDFWEESQFYNECGLPNCKFVVNAEYLARKFMFYSVPNPQISLKILRAHYFLRKSCFTNKLHN